MKRDRREAGLIEKRFYYSGHFANGECSISISRCRDSLSGKKEIDIFKSTFFEPFNSSIIVKKCITLYHGVRFYFISYFTIIIIVISMHLKKRIEEYYSLPTFRSFERHRYKFHTRNMQ